MHVLVMILKNQMMRFKWCWDSGECGAPLFCHCSKVHSAEGKDTSNACPGYDTKESDDEIQVMLGLWGMWSTPFLPLLQGTLWSRMAAPDGALSMGYLELNCIFMLKWIVWIRTVWLNWIAWNRNVFFTIKLWTYIWTAYLC